jgi:hypothetical protein
MKHQELFYGTVIGSFDIFGEITGRQLILTSVIGNTLATDPFAGTGVIGTITVFFVGLDPAFHGCCLF